MLYLLEPPRHAMQETFSDRDAERKRADAFREACELVRERSTELFDALREVDDEAEVGAYANRDMRAYTEPADETSGPVFEDQAHWGARVEKGPEQFRIILLIDFGIAIDTTRLVHLSGFGFTGYEQVMGGVPVGPVHASAPMATI